MNNSTLRPLFLSLLLGATAALFACGGGGGGGDAPPPAPAPAPAPAPVPLPPGWQSAAHVLADTTVAVTATVPQVALDDSGNAIAVWQQSDGAREAIWAGRYTPSTGWGTPTLIELIPPNNANIGNAFSPKIAMDAAGNVIAVWMQFEGTRSDIWANRYTASTGAWGTATLIEHDDAGNTISPEIAVSPGGNAMVVWTQLAGSESVLWVNNYSAGQWGEAQSLDRNVLAPRPKVAMDASGNAIAVWMRFNSVINSNLLITQRYSASTGLWGAEEFLNPAVRNSGSNPTISFDSSGNAFAAWQQFDGTSDSIWTRLYSADNGWRADTMLVPGSSGAAARNPRVTLNAAGSGSAMVVWQQAVNSNGAFYDGVFANYFNLTTNQWVSATSAVTAPLGSALDVRVTDDRKGSVIAVWSQLNGTRHDVWTSRYGPDGIGGAAWGTVQLLETDNTGNADTPYIAADRLGNAMAVWSQKVGALTRIWFNIFINDKL